MPTEFPFPDPADIADPAERHASQAWAHIATLFLSQQDHREQVAAELGINLGEMIPLFHLRPGQGTSQRELAHEWSCDPSWVTNRIDRLEALGLAERRVSPTDRRVKEVWLTAEGELRRQAGMAGFAKVPAELLDLSASDLETLARIVAKLPAPKAAQPTS